jgi:1,4-dihydroxy-6-naphthoate synthase
MQRPLPLAAIAIRRDLADRWAERVDRALRSSVEYAFAHPDASRDYVASLAQEMDPQVIGKHIQLYVNDYTLALDETAVESLLEWARQHADGRVDTSLMPTFA